MKYPKKNENKLRQGDLVVLKPYLCCSEKGVILISYNDSFEKFLAIFDLEAIAERYRIVLEPSTWGYQDVIFWLFRDLETDIFVQAQDEEDFNYIKKIAGKLVPIRLGAGDWGDAEIFSCGGVDKKYDIIMVASWQLLKRHRLFFDALSQIKKHIGKVCLIGYPSEGRTKDNIVADADDRGVLGLLEIFENIDPVQVARKICMSKNSVMLSKREGASKVLYESLFCDVPVILSSLNRGVNREIVNSQTGILTSDEDLAANLLQMIGCYRDFSPREWAIQNTGYCHSHSILNTCVRDLAIACGESWTQDIYMKKNATNPVYVIEGDRLRAEEEFASMEKLLAC